MKIVSTSLEGVILIIPPVFKDDRGFFMEVFQQKKYNDLGIERIFVQDNLSHSVKGTLRGLHFQVKQPQGKLVQVIRGEIFDVAVDIRHESPTFGKWTSVHLSSQNKHQLYVPEGFAHGFCVLSDSADVLYKCTDYYAPHDEGGILWSDPDIAITWPVKDPVLSPKDSRYPYLRDISSEGLP